MQTAVYARLQRLFGHRDWPEGEPLMIGGRRVGTVTPQGDVIGAPGVKFVPFADDEQQRR